jgi:hypothetical protein
MIRKSKSRKDDCQSISEKLPLYESSMIIDSQEKLKDKKIKLEKRKRNQAYESLDYLLSMKTYFDFFSNDAITVIIKSKFLANSIGSEIINSECLIPPFISKQTTEIKKILLSSKINTKQVKDLFWKFNVPIKRSFGDKFVSKAKEIPLFSKIFPSKTRLIDPDIDFSRETYNILEKASENAFFRFKTLVITPEILFITIMEEKNTRAGRIINRIVQDKMDWCILRYKLLKRIHYQELGIRNQIRYNQLYFAYLLKIELTEDAFDYLVEHNVLWLAVYYFRGNLVKETLSTDLTDVMRFNIYKSIRANNKRRYST